ncbi:hypothetical protein MY4038_007725 [Beauveria bassiana]
MSAKATSQSGTVYSGPFGGTGGTPFQELPDAGGEKVQSIQMWEDYENGDYVVVGVKLTWPDDSIMAGQNRGTPKPDRPYVFAADEKFRTMTIRAGRYIDNISFETNLGTFEAGGKGGSANTVDVGNGELVGFDGRAARCIDNVNAKAISTLLPDFIQ